MTYSSASHVAGLTQNLISGACNFSTSSSPTLAAVSNWLDSGQSVIDSYLSGHRYAVPVASGTQAFDWLENLNALYAAAMAETSRTNITLGPGERTRGRVMLEQFWNELKLLVSLDLTGMGVSRASAGKLYVGGISEADKETYEEDSDRTSPRFSRSMFNFPGTISPGTDSAS